MLYQFLYMLRTRFYLPFSNGERNCEYRYDIPSSFTTNSAKKENDRIFIAIDHCGKSKFDNVIIALKHNQEISNIGFVETIIPDVNKDSVQAKNVLVISKVPLFSEARTSNPNEFYLETLDELLIPKVTATLFAGKSYMKARVDYLPWKQLIQDFRLHLAEILRRIAIGLLCSTMTFAGLAMGTYKPRFHKPILIYALFPILNLVFLIVGKNTSHPISAIMLFLFPQILSWLIFSWRIYKENQGHA